MQPIHYVKKDKKEIKSINNCLFCSRLLTQTELYFNSNYCVICKIKYGLTKPNAELNKTIK
jgi:hypothetical protein